MSSITYLEAFEGTLRQSDPGRAANRLGSLVVKARVLAVDIAVAERCARIRDHFRTAGRRIDSRRFDLLIAATALEYGLTLVTRNVRD